ncbi:MAG: hypothetical protein HC877_12570 [Thioploca sp.]|nr:hypothetical protein [Thioploca sp.]
MRFSVIRIMTNVVVVFMILGYPGIGQAKDCGDSNRQDMPKTITTSEFCVTHNSIGEAIREGSKHLQQLMPKCEKKCNIIEGVVCPKWAPNCVADEKQKHIDYKKNKNGQINITCQTTLANPELKCRDNQDKYVCSVEILKVTCPCKCCKPQSKVKGLEIGQCNPETEDCGCDSDLVDLDEFTATPQKDGISLTWTTKSELDSQGFRVWRGTPDLGKYCGCSDNMDDYKQITMTTLDEKGNPTLIPATGSTTSGSNYAYLDKDVKPGIPYCYALEDIDSKGESKFYYEYITFTPDAELEQSTQ